MHFDIAHSQGKARAQALHGRRQLRLERALRTRLRHFLDGVFAAAAEHARHGVFDVEHVVASHTATLQRIIGSHYTIVGQFFLASVEEAYVKRGGRKTADSGTDKPANRPVIENKNAAADKGVGLAGGGRNSGLETKGMADEFWRAFHSWAFGDAFREVRQINAATTSILRRVLRREADKGSNYDNIANAITAAAKTINRTRAERIARTEVHRASTFAVNEAVRSTRVKFDREWVNMNDDRTRPVFGNAVTKKNPWDHRKANGQRRGMNEPFDVSGEKLMFPGDTSLGASAGNTIQCRCILIYVPARPVGVWT